MWCGMSRTEVSETGQTLFSCRLPTLWSDMDGIRNLTYAGGVLTLATGHEARWVERLQAFSVPASPPATSGWTGPCGGNHRMGRPR
jgi:hypothetical protein